MGKQSVNRSMFFILLLICFLCTPACGRKMPPVPPGAPPLPPVTDLKHRLDGDRVSLSWTAPSGAGSDQLAGYAVLRSVADPDEDCSGCPILFERVRSLGPSITDYSEPVTPGRQYIYKVLALTAYQAPSPDSDLIRFRVPAKDRGGS